MQEPLEMLCSTSATIAGRQISETLGVVWGVFVTNKKGSPSEQMKTADGGRHEAYRELVKRAKSMGADAVVGLKFDSLVVGRGGDSGPVDREYVAYGTAVVLGPWDG